MNSVILNEINNLKMMYPFLNGKKNDYVVNAVAIRNILYKNPSIVLDEASLKEQIIDASDDNGVDCLVTDLNSDYHDCVFVQCKDYQTITLAAVKASLNKMIAAYRSFIDGRYEQFNSKAVDQWQRVNDEMEEGGKTRFCFVTTAPRSRIRNSSILDYFNMVKGDLDIEMTENDIYFESELSEAINDAKCLRPNVECGSLVVDDPNNFLKYNGSIIVNISAFSLKELYSKHKRGLFAQNLRYFVTRKLIDDRVKDTIKDSPEEFWFRNNGITIICDEAKLDGSNLLLKNFSIINGGQTTVNIFESEHVNKNQDFSLMCRVIQNIYDDEEDKKSFVFEIAKASNSQKAIKPSDLKANEPEQMIFVDYMKPNGVFYVTKRGENIPDGYKNPWQHCDLQKAGKLALAGVFLMPGTSRSNPSIIYNHKDYYDGIFGSKVSSKTSKLVSHLLYCDHYFDKQFIAKYKNSCVKNMSVFAGNCRTLCLSYLGFIAKYAQGEFTEEEIKRIADDEFNEESIADIEKLLGRIDRIDKILPNSSVNCLENDAYLEMAFRDIIKRGYDKYTTIMRERTPDKKQDETGWLKKNLSFYLILKSVANEILCDSESFRKYKELFLDNSN